MAKINVTVSELFNAVNLLNERNGSFRGKVVEMAGLESELGAMWQGEANNAFRTAFNNDRQAWDNFAKLVDQYIATLKSIADRYVQTEETNTTQAKNRTY